MAANAARTFTPEQAFAARFRELRERRQLSQADVADAATALGLPLHQQTIAKIEGDKRPIRLDEAHALAQIVGASVADLLKVPMTPAELRAAIKTTRSAVAELEAQALDADAACSRARDELLRAERDVTRYQTRLALRRQQLASLEERRKEA